MYNLNAKKQNRILLVCLVVVLTAATVLVALTGSANKNKGNKKPPIDTSINETEVPDTTSRNTVTPGIPDKTEPAETNLGNTDDVAGETEKPADKDVSVMQPVEDVLPKFSAPVENMVIKGFSITVPVFSYTMNDYRTHNGVDFACSPGTPVLAAADGTVCEIKDDPMMGVTVAISHSGGAVTKYKGLSEDSMNICKVGDTVKRGDVIGSSGDTALIESAEESHLHFELYVNGEAKDPGEYMKVSYLSDTVED